MSLHFKFFIHGWQRWQQSNLRRSGRNSDKIDNKNHQQQWFLLSGILPETNLALRPNFGSLNPIYPPENAFWADPFIWIRDGKRFIFFEDFPFETWRGRISVLEVDAAGLPMSDPVPVLEENHHLSYPFLFEHDGMLYMIPEKSEVKRIDLYRCVEFPHHWTFEKTLINGIKAADPTLFEHEGRWWLFCAAKKGRVRINESLFAYYADSPLSGQWTAHSANPIVRDFSSGRPAGRIFLDAAGRLLRPSQDCVRRYGHGLNLNVIEQLTPSDYKESLLWKISGDEVGLRGIHHLDGKDGLVVMDAQRLLTVQSVQEAASDQQDLA